MIPKVILRRLLLALASVLIVGLIVAPLTLLWAALYTESGAQFVVRHLPRHLGPVDLDITGLSGTVAHGLHVERVEIDHELVHLTFTNIAGQVRLAPLLLQSIRVTYASVEGAKVQVKRRVHPPTPSPPSFLPRWLQISADEAHVKRADLSVYNGFEMEVTDITADALLRHLDIRIFQAAGVLEGANFIVMGDLLATDPLGFRVKGHLDWHPAGQPAYVVDGSARGDLNILNVVAREQSPFRTDVSGQLRDLANHFHWVASVQVLQFELSPWGVSTPLGTISGHLTGAGDADTFSAKGTLDPAGLGAGNFEVQFEGGFAHHVLTAKSMEARHVASGARARGAGTIAVVDHGPRLDLKGSWEQFRWPLPGRDPVVRSAAGTFTLAGDPALPRARGRGHARARPALDAGRRRRHARQGQLCLQARGRRPLRRSHERERQGHLGSRRDLRGERPRERHRPGAAARRSAREPELRLQRFRARLRYAWHPERRLQRSHRQAARRARERQRRVHPRR